MTYKAELKTLPSLFFLMLHDFDSHSVNILNIIYYYIILSVLTFYLFLYYSDASNAKKSIFIKVDLFFF